MFGARLVLLGLSLGAQAHNPHDLVTGLASWGEHVWAVLWSKLYFSPDGGETWERRGRNLYEGYIPELATVSLARVLTRERNQADKSYERGGAAMFFALSLRPWCNGEGLAQLYLMQRGQNSTDGAKGTLFRSVNNGRSWHPLLTMKEFLPACSGATVAVDQRTRSILIAGTPAAMLNASLIRSTDLGTTWQPVKSVPGVAHAEGPVVVIVTIQAHGIIAAGTARGVLILSRDGGRSWQRPLPGSATVNSEAVISIEPVRSEHPRELLLLIGSASSLQRLVLDERQRPLSQREVWHRGVQGNALNGVRAVALPTSQMLFILGKHTVESSSDGGRSWSVHGCSTGLYGQDANYGSPGQGFREIGNWTHLAVTSSGRLLLGSTNGLFRRGGLRRGGRPRGNPMACGDDDSMWRKVNVADSTINSLTVASTGGGRFLVLACTEWMGCYTVELSVAALGDGVTTVASGGGKGGRVAKPQQMQPHPTLGDANCSSYVVGYSPNYSTDGLLLASCSVRRQGSPPARSKGPNRLPWLRRSTDGGARWNEVYWSRACKSGSCVRSGIMVWRIVFSPAFANDGRVWATAERVGLAVSVDRGATFDQVEGPWLWDANKMHFAEIALSPQYASTGTAVLMVYPLRCRVVCTPKLWLSRYGQEGWVELRATQTGDDQLLGDDQFMWISVAIGALAGPTGGCNSTHVREVLVGSRSTLKQAKRMSLHSAPINGGPRLAALDLSAAHGYNLTWLQTPWDSVRPSGFGENAVVFAPGCTGELLSSWWDGGALRAQLHSNARAGISLSKFLTSTPPPWAEPGITESPPQWAFYNVDFRRSTSRVLYSLEYIANGPHVVYLPTQPNVLVGGSHTAVLVSFDGGANWKKVAEIPQRSCSASLAPKLSLADGACLPNIFNEVPPECFRAHCPYRPDRCWRTPGSTMYAGNKTCPYEPWMALGPNGKRRNASSLPRGYTTELVPDKY